MHGFKTHELKSYYRTHIKLGLKIAIFSLFIITSNNKSYAAEINLTSSEYHFRIDGAAAKDFLGITTYLNI
ncbi:hypothetical protein H6802_00350 [Candidatus Nomurabacteria bacterium]|uniref:Uncharacterized protein n=1 Tax=candidate division WWE3 bacterium TaxID=2053526 RepID=A0A955E1G1_UNCKA|nr:hypothetical protein [candidate division WWE3 bacterium]MCB9823401.1 hypothetical protein [Candidatus Nomurabacteria bacterium]MCB9827683.1 hypothetical protein [Candidatus Nomurabacteria bacterium]